MCLFIKGRKCICITNRNDVARVAGVSGATVSRVLNSPEMVSQEIREKVLSAAKELNYHPNVIASNFVRRKSGNIGVIIPRIPNVHIFSVYYFSELLSGIGEALSENGYDLVLFFHRVEAGVENDYSTYFRGGKIDGCIMLGTLRDDTGLLRLKGEGYNFCLINNYIKGSGISFIDVDNIQGSFDAVSHLIARGHREIVFLNGPQYYSNSIDRFTGYARALKQNDIPLKPDYLMEGNYGKKSGYVAAARVLELKKKPTAVFAGNDRMAAGMVQGLREKGVRIPADISVVGYDDSDTATMIDPPLTTVRIPFYELGKRCVYEFMKQVNEGSTEAFEVLVKPQLVVRSSSSGVKA